jgi:hypothetical protein
MTENLFSHPPEAELVETKGDHTEPVSNPEFSDRD